MTNKMTQQPPVADLHDPVDLLQAYVSRLKDKKNDLERLLCYGSVEDFQTYLKFKGQLQGVSSALQEFEEIVKERVRSNR